jgi:hypothetical protein
MTSIARLRHRPRKDLHWGALAEEITRDDTSIIERNANERRPIAPEEMIPRRLRAVRESDVQSLEHTWTPTSRTSPSAARLRNGDREHQ